MGAGKSTFTDLNFSLQLLDGTFISWNVDVLLLLDDLDEVIDDSLIEILTSQMCITRGTNNLKDTVIDGQDGYIKSTTSQIKD